jgi:glycosyltransferase involved in cell wall biosynthesis
MSYTPLPNPVPIKDQKWPEGTQPLVTTRTMTYNHVEYIEKCLDGILMQETTFPVQVLIHDDASDDGTVEKLKEYEKKFPNALKIYFQEANSYRSPKKKALREPFFNLIKGKYIALCEGDDYWTDTTKLQKQAEFLESNDDYVIAYHDAVVVDPEGKLLEDSKMSDGKKKDSSAEDLILGSSHILTLSMMYRNKGNIRESCIEAKYIKNGDNLLTAFLGQFGKGKYMPDIKPAVYLRHSGGIWSSFSEKEKAASKLNSYFWMYQYFKRIDNPIGKRAYFKKVGQLMNKTDDEYNLIMVKKGFFSKIVSFIARISN